MPRTKLPAYDELVVRELLVNALVHRPYTQRGDLYLNLHPDRLEVVASGRVVATGETRARKFRLAPGVSGHGDDDGQ